MWDENGKILTVVLDEVFAEFVAVVVAETPEVDALQEAAARLSIVAIVEHCEEEGAG